MGTTKDGEPDWGGMVDGELDERTQRTRARMTNIFMSGWSEGAPEDPTYFCGQFSLPPKESKTVVLGVAEAFEPFASRRAMA